ncbi:MAG TPA: hypothetical protein VEC11_08440 [Allosphingosinicella sp.]|nr:hypothetical protein [Allosphingosinicella sp.]
MSRETQITPPVVTHHVNVQQALETLDYDEMLALSSMFQRWALQEVSLNGEQRTKLMQWSADYEQIAAFAGSGWIASDPSAEPDAMAFTARLELKSAR